MYSGHLDTFVIENLPPPTLAPEILFGDFSCAEKMNAAEILLDERCCLFGQKPFLFCEEHYWTYQDLLHKANQIAQLLIEQYQLKPGNRILIHATNTPMQIACWFAGLKVGAICVLSTPLLKAGELAHIINTAQINCFLCEEVLLPEANKTRALINNPLKIASFSAYGDQNAEIDVKTRHYSYLFTNRLLSASDPAIIAFSSGTTQLAKATVHTHRDLLTICKIFPQQILKMSDSDICCGTPALGFTYGLGGLVLFPMYYGASVVLLKNNQVDEVVHCIQHHAVTHFFSNPTMYLRMLNQVENLNVAPLKYCTSAGEHLPSSTYYRWLEKTKLSLINAIGSTEMLHIFMSTHPSDRTYRGLGDALAGYQVLLLDEQGSPVEQGKPGLLAIKGPTGCRYLNDPISQSKYVREGWNITGDLCVQESDNSFIYQSRADDLIISSGYNISGYEVEDILVAHHKIKECAVVGVRDNERGQVVKAFIVLEPEITRTDSLVHELQCFVKERISPYKYPRAIEFIDALPRNSNGKIQRSVLKNG